MIHAPEVICKIIPLYKVTILYDNNEDNYDRVIVADSIEGIIRGIVDIEMDHESKLDVDEMRFDIQDFLYMPCDRAIRGFHLFDIDDVDCAVPHGASIDDETYYYCYFSGDSHPGPRRLDDDASERSFAEPHPVTDVNINPDPDNIRKWERDQDAYIGAIYRISKSHPYRQERIDKRRQGDLRDEQVVATVKRQMAKEKRA